MGLGVYFIYSAALSGIHLSPCVCMSKNTIYINTICPLVTFMLHSYHIPENAGGSYSDYSGEKTLMNGLQMK